MSKFGLTLTKIGCALCWLSAAFGWAAIFYMMW